MRAEVREHNLPATSCSPGSAHALSGSAGGEGALPAWCRALRPSSLQQVPWAGTKPAVSAGVGCAPRMARSVSHQPGSPVLSGPLTRLLLQLLGGRCWVCPFSSPLLSCIPPMPFSVSCVVCGNGCSSASQSPDYFLRSFGAVSLVHSDAHHANSIVPYFSFCPACSGVHNLKHLTYFIFNLHG